MNKQRIYILAVAGSFFIASCGSSNEETNNAGGKDSVEVEKPVDTSTSANEKSDELYSDDFIEEASVMRYHIADKSKSIFWAYNMNTDVAYLYEGNNVEEKQRIIIHKEEREANTNNRMCFALYEDAEEELMMYLDYGDPGSSSITPVRIVISWYDGSKQEFLPEEK